MNIYTVRKGIAVANGIPTLDITASTNKSVNGRGFLFTPSWDIVNAVKNKKISSAEYTDRYFVEVNAKLKGIPIPKFGDPDKLLPQPVLKDSLKQLYRNDSIALECYCDSLSFCHRFLAAQFLAQNTNNEYIGEITTDGLVRWYTGVGSRDAPKDVLDLMTEIARKMASLGFMLRTGNARGSDRAFSLGAGGKKIIFNPEDATENYIKIARSLYPNTRIWDGLKPVAKALHGRNVLQMYGYGLLQPSEYVICWTEDGCDHHSTRTLRTGGTGTVISLATLDCPLRFSGFRPNFVNLARHDHRQAWENWVKA